MPKVKSLEELMVEINKKKQEVDNKEQALEKARKEYTELCNKKNALMLNKINEALNSSTMTYDDILDFLEQNKKETSDSAKASKKKK